MLQLIYELKKNCCGTGGRDGTGRDIEGSTRGPRGPKKSGLKKKSLTGREREEGEREGNTRDRSVPDGSDKKCFESFG